VSYFAPTAPNDAGGVLIQNDGFFPDFTVADFRDATRLQDTVTDGRVLQALRTAMMDVNRELRPWQSERQAEGHAGLFLVPSVHYGDQSELMHWYLVAVFSRAKAQILEQYRDIDTADKQGSSRAAAFEGTREGYLREAREAIRNVLGRRHATIELI